MDGTHYVRLIFFVVVLNDLVNILFFNHPIVVDKATQNLDIVQLPDDSVLTVEDVVADHRTKTLLVLVADGDLIVLVEHKPEIPITAGSGTIPRLLILDLERRMEIIQRLIDEVDDLIVVKLSPA